MFFQYEMLKKYEIVEWKGDGREVGDRGGCR